MGIIRLVRNAMKRRDIIDRNQLAEAITPQEAPQIEEEPIKVEPVQPPPEVKSWICSLPERDMTVRYPIFERKSGAVGSANISIVMMTYEKKPDELITSLGSLSAQTFTPREIIVVDTNYPVENPYSDEIRSIVSRFPLAKLVRCPYPTFSLSLGMNIGIQHTLPDAMFVLTTCPEMIFSETVLEWLFPHLLLDKRFYIAPCGRLNDDAKIPDEPWKEWELFSRLIERYPPYTFSLGTFIVIDRAWWFRVRGYDEIHHPYNWADSDITMRAKMDGYTMMVLPWEDAQVLHIAHPQSLHLYGVSSQYIDPEFGIFRNPDKWGGIVVQPSAT